MSTPGLTSSAVVAFLQARGVSATALDRIIENNLDSDAVLLMTDEQLSAYVPGVVDRICLVAKCKIAERLGSRQRPGTSINSRQTTAAANRARGHQDASTSNPIALPARCKRGPKPSNMKTVTFTCILFDESIQEFKTVREINGGGHRRCKVDKDSGRIELLTIAQKIFFRGGNSKIGCVSDFDLDLFDFEKRPIINTIAEMLEITCLPNIKLYLACKHRQASNNANHALPLPEVAISPIPATMPSTSFATTPIQESMPGTSFAISPIQAPMPCTSFAITPIQRSMPGTSFAICHETTSEDELDLPDLACEVVIEVDSESIENDQITAKEILNELNSQIISTKKSLFNICRASLWECAKRGLFRKSFRPRQALDVTFGDTTGNTEGAINNGGPAREFLTLVVEYLASSGMFDQTSRGPVLSRYSQFSHPEDADGVLQEKSDYYCAGLFLALSMVHGGIAPKFLSRTAYKLITSDPVLVNVQLEDVPPCSLRTALEAFRKASFDDKVNMLGDEPLSSALDYAGVVGHLRDDKAAQTLENELCKWYVYHRAKSSYDDFKEGLAHLGVLNAVEAHSQVLENTLCLTERATYTARTFENIFIVQRSEKDSNRYHKESKILIWWRDLLSEIEDDEGIDFSGSSSDILTFEKILQFVTGAKCEPTIGWAKKPEIEFLHDKIIGCDGIEYDCKFPTANTCACILKLPTIGATYSKFRENCISGFISGGAGFGYA